MERIQRFLAGEIDYIGQLKAERLQKYIISTTTIIAFVIGWAMQRIEVTGIIFVAGCVIAAIVVGPAWPCYNKNPVKWNDNGNTKKSN